MEYCSLEEDDFGGMFITQESRNIVPLAPNFEMNGYEKAGVSEVIEIGTQNEAKYSDISDTEDFDIPASQIQRKISPIKNAGNIGKPNSIVKRGLSRIFGVNSRSRTLGKSRLALKKAVSRKFSYVCEDRIADLKNVKMKPNSASKVNWGVNAYNEWRDDRLLKFQYDIGIYCADLNDLKSLTKENFNHALCRFIPEVTKQKGGGPYPGRTLYQMIKAIQKHLNVNKLPWKLVEKCDVEFEDAKNVLDNVMKERTAQNIGVSKKQANVITHGLEERLWNEGILGEDSPEKLRDTVLFLLGLHAMLRAVDEHYHLRRDVPGQNSQLQFERDEEGNKCLVYREDFVSKTHDGGIADRKFDRKEVWMFPNNDKPERCIVRLVDKYLSLCPMYYRKSNFYLQCLQRPTPKQWYGEQVIGTHTIGKVVSRLMEKANIIGFFTNHSLRRSGGTRLFRGGVDRKLVKEFTGHRSDVVDTYQVTSMEQRRMISNVIKGQDEGKLSVSKEETEGDEAGGKEGTSEHKVSKCKCCVVTEEIVGEIISKIVNEAGKKGKVVIKMEFEVHNE